MNENVKICIHKYTYIYMRGPSEAIETLVYVYKYVYFFSIKNIEFA